MKAKDLYERASRKEKIMKNDIMKREMQFMDPYGDTESVFLCVATYAATGGIYVGLYCQDDGEEIGDYEEFADITICIPTYSLAKEEAFISGDSSKEILEFVGRYELGEILPGTVCSGYGEYHRVRFDMEKLKVYDPDGVSSVETFWSEHQSSIETRLIAISTKPDVGGSVVILKTNVPEERLKQLEKASHEAYAKTGTGIIWTDIVESKDYTIEAVDAHSDTDVIASPDWMRENYPEIQEIYSLC